MICSQVCSVESPLRLWLFYAHSLLSIGNRQLKNKTHCLGLTRLVPSLPSQLDLFPQQSPLELDQAH